MGYPKIEIIRRRLGLACGAEPEQFPDRDGCGFQILDFSPDVWTGEGDLARLILVELLRRFPFVEEGDDVVGVHGPGGFPFAVLLSHEEFSVAVENGERRHALVEDGAILGG